MPVTELVRQVRISAPTSYLWKNQSTGLEIDQSVS